MWTIDLPGLSGVCSASGERRKVLERRVPIRNQRYLRTLRPSRPGLYRITANVDGASTRQYVRVT